MRGKVGRNEVEREAQVAAVGFEELVAMLGRQFGELPDHRRGANKQYEIADAVKAAFSVFFTQTPSFLAYQRSMEASKGRNNAQSLFGVGRVPCDNQIRALLDPLEPGLLDEVFFEILAAVDQVERLADFRMLGQQWLVSLDGTGYFASKTIHCPNCLQRTTNDGQTLYYHSAILPVIVKPGSSQVLSLPPEFIQPQDGDQKQDCERKAAKRWLDRHADRFAPNSVTLLGDDLYSNQPLCQLALDHDFNFILVSKPDSHPILYQWLDFLAANDDLDQLQVHHFNGRFTEIAAYRFINEVPLRGGEEALTVNWVEVTITHAKTGERLYFNTFVTNHWLTADTVPTIVQAGRARWKSENEQHNILKTKGYHLEHNFGHGHQFLASFLLTLNLLAFLVHTVLEILDDDYRTLRAHLVTRQTFFQDLRTLTRYFYFDSWHHLLSFMRHQLELSPPLDSS